MRNTNSPYLADPFRNGTHVRSKEVVKYKAHHSDEFKVVGFMEGSNGRDKGAIIWICETDKGSTFHTVPKNQTYKWRYKMFTDLSADNNKLFISKYVGRMITVEYDALSTSGVPLRAKSSGFRGMM